MKDVNTKLPPFLTEKGVDFSRRRIQTHLEKFLRHHENGYILLIDFSKFFDNIPHDLLYKRIKEKLKDDDSIDWLLKMMLNSFSYDVSYMSDEEYQNIDNVPFDSLVHRKRKREYDGPIGEKTLHRSMGIGSQMSQISGVFYPCIIDNYFKCVKGFKYYGRYMDDTYIISESKKELQNALENFIKQAEKLELFVNRKKTQIIKLTHEFTYLKVIYKVKGKKIIKRLHKSTFIRERIKLKKFKARLCGGKMTMDTIHDSYFSWRGNVIKKHHCKKNVKYTDDLFIKLFIKNI